MWNKCNVVMFPSVSLQRGDIVLENGRLRLAESMSKDLLNTKAKPQHLYITSNEEIKSGDKCYNSYDSRIWEYRDSPCPMPYWGNKDTLKKIIATADMSLGLPLIPQQFINVFIEQYNKGTVIKEVEVEYRRWTEFSGNHSITPTIDILMVNSDNTINIKQAKDSWSRKEVIELLHKYESDMTYFGRDSYYKGCFPKVTDDWANENL